MEPDDIRFGSLKEDRGWYFVEYTPPIPNYRFSTLCVCIVEGHDAQAVAFAIEKEARDWLMRYQAPLMATAFSADGGIFSLKGVRPIDHMVAWRDSESSQVVFRWELVKDALPDIALDRNFLQKTFADVPSKTGAEIQNEVVKDVAARKVGWWLVFVWAVVVPLGVAVLEWWSDLLGLVVLLYAFVKAIIHALRLMGHLPKSDREREKEAQELRMRHHHYHCERNPEGFERLKAESFRREEIARTKAEALVLKVQARNGPIDG
ncbi:hypothetical protein SAMN05660860_00887 [Geoalkalibacter ferrihydriticus]|uniref:Uncharacterized protein n=2 Tax=Geoalkalibacter ferrihydriticus TaxID=392333 RepID=A0A0C2DTG7_9BACT|nr:hypothetical protein [Geoalkalibacter ferrihydriticus]KIH76739.1 hypothetical protein GFER_06270 [Geoalkalibacter ferrihydriticus DSM 17813]SDL54343.1 hypothetical protein SAMN05660860_00887 [Geoalkalibacter ferrihydriticus]